MRFPATRREAPAGLPHGSAAGWSSLLCHGRPCCVKALRPPRHGVPQLVPRLHCRKGDRRSCRPRPCSEVSPEGHVTSYSQHRRTGAPRTTTLPKVIFKNSRGKIRVRLIVLKRAVPQQRAHSRVPHEPRRPSPERPPAPKLRPITRSLLRPQLAGNSVLPSVSTGLPALGTSYE